MHRLALLILLITSTAAADTYDIGFRVGGYGFRREGDGGWDECRMNGAGLFASRVLTGPLYLEAGLDAYSSAGNPPSTDLPIDRMSGILSSAIGARAQLTSWLRGYLQLGAGVELTRVSVHYDTTTFRDQKVMPAGFFGVGFDIRIAHGTYLGAAMRTLVMGNFDYDPGKLEMQAWGGAPSSDLFKASPDLAAQGQFYVRRDL